jgi:glucose-1-phosphate adenylyltransferase
METLALILAGGRGSRLDILSEKRAKPGVPFAGKFRIIDFALSNCSNSGIYDIGILTQYQPLSLNEHIGMGQPWDFNRRNSGVTLLQPYESLKGDSWYNGTADAVLQNIEYIKRKKAKYVLILSGDHIYKMDYKKLIDFHKEKGADVTVCAQPVPIEEASRFGILSADDNMKIVEFAEKPKVPKSDLASMGIYVFNTDVLLNALETIKEPDLDFGKHIIPVMIENNHVFCYRFEDYWKDVGTYDSYLEANLELTQTVDKVPLDMYDPDWVIHTKSEERPAAKFGLNAKVKQCLISNGCIIAGEVEKSVLGPGVDIRPGAIVKNSVIFNDTVIEAGAVVDGAIIDKNAIVRKDCKIGYGNDLSSNKDKPEVLTSGLNVIGKGAEIPEGTVIERNCRILSHVTPDDFDSKEVKSGTTVAPKK